MFQSIKILLNMINVSCHGDQDCLVGYIPIMAMAMLCSYQRGVRVQLPCYFGRARGTLGMGFINKELQPGTWDGLSPGPAAGPP